MTELMRAADGEGWRQLGLDGCESFDIEGMVAAIDGTGSATVIATGAAGSIRFLVTADVSTRSERACLRAGGIMAEVLAFFTRRAAPALVTEHP